jgi:hypothetical protein
MNLEDYLQEHYPHILEEFNAMYDLHKAANQEDEGNPFAKLWEEADMIAEMDAWNDENPTKRI